MKKVSVVIPAYNEAENIAPVFGALKQTFETLPYEWDVIFVNDGSKDNTLETLMQLADVEPKLKYISLSRNLGKDSALKAGFDAAEADCVITMDADLQHSPRYLAQFLQKWEEGYDIVYAYRKESNSHTSVVHRFFSWLFWSVLNAFSDIKLEQGISDFRLIDKKAIEALRTINEYEIFFRGMIKWVGISPTRHSVCAR